MKEIFFESFFSLVRLFLSTKDEFLKQKLVKKTREFFVMVQKSGHVAQSVDNQLTPKLIDDLSEFIEILVHLNVSDLSSALLVQKNLLCLRLEILDLASTKNLKEEKEDNHPEKPRKRAKNLKYKNLESEILQIIKTKPEGLPLREVILTLHNQCSRRTVQRYLNKLISDDFILKKGKNGSAKYYAIPSV